MARDTLPEVELTARVAPELPFWHIMPGDSDVHKTRKYAYGLILDENKWCRWRSAKNATGEKRAPNADDAVRFCAWGAFQRAEHDLQLPKGTGEKAFDSVTLVLDVINDWFGRRAALSLMKHSILRN